jgi:hypothetical protein
MEEGMRLIERPGGELKGRYRDVVRAPGGEVLTDSGWSDNAIVLDCRRLLASLMAGAPAAGIQGILIGAGLPAWDVNGPPAATPGQIALVDPSPFLVPVADLQIDFLDNGNVTATPTNRLQIVASLGPGEPPWPDGSHIASSLREFGLVGQLDGNPALINYVTHPVINKDPTSTLERTLWLVF